MESSNGTLHVRESPRIADAASARWRAPPNTTAADFTKASAAGVKPSMPSSPIPTMDSHRCDAAVCGVGSASAMKRHVLILGGTTEARELAQKLSERADLAVTISLAGRTAVPTPQPVPVRTGGFGGVAGLAQYLAHHKISALIDATHPYAVTMSAHAVTAARETRTPLIVLRRPAWRPTPTDRWTQVADAREAAQALGAKPLKVFLAVGRQEIAPFELAPQHYYLIRSVDPVEPPLALPWPIIFRPAAVRPGGRTRAAAASRD